MGRSAAVSLVHLEGVRAQAGIQKVLEKEEEVRTQMKKWIRTCGEGAEVEALLALIFGEIGNV